MSEQPDSLTEVVRAVNRTTHAVRALVRFVLIETISGIFGSVALFISSLFVAAPALEWLFILVGIVFLAGGLIWACLTALDELRLSDVPGVVDYGILATISGGSAPHVSSGGDVKPPMDVADQNVFSTLSDSQKAAWAAARRPLLSRWDRESETFEAWLKRNAW